ncbi:hypothetical protein BU23DRAFT_97667 [Bimuria novae-zelandiae CBS 107.79]|uniref:Uncharacterized protein n=1 Tax=Bimuria novae-zelandiae CBS 107.79 TaxID=1447943 RepID=A0A6A5VR48_9PLEO|nr:hypothetical protein BU23DRAFT_97667 [Bimuria novae-zelandiae CBS 107.79]
MLPSTCPLTRTSPLRLNQPSRTSFWRELSRQLTFKPKTNARLPTHMVYLSPREGGTLSHVGRRSAYFMVGVLLVTGLCLIFHTILMHSIELTRNYYEDPSTMTTGPSFELFFCMLALDLLTTFILAGIFFTVAQIMACFAWKESRTSFALVPHYLDKEVQVEDVVLQKDQGVSLPYFTQRNLARRLALLFDLVVTPILGFMLFVVSTAFLEAVRDPAAFPTVRTFLLAPQAGALFGWTMCFSVNLVGVCALELKAQVRKESFKSFIAYMNSPMCFSNGYPSVTPRWFWILIALIFGTAHAVGLYQVSSMPWKDNARKYFQMGGVAVAVSGIVSCGYFLVAVCLAETKTGADDEMEYDGLETGEKSDYGSTWT